MADSSQKFIARNRAPRVQIEYDVELYGSEKKVQLPFVMGVMSDLAGKSKVAQPEVEDRKFLEIDADNFDDRMKAMAPRAAFTVPNTLTGDGNLSVDLTFEKMSDFSPAAIAEKVDTLRPLLEARTQLSNLMAYMDGKAGAEALIENILSDVGLLAAISAGASGSDETHAAFESLKAAMPDEPNPEDETTGVLDALRKTEPNEVEDKDEAAEALMSLQAALPPEVEENTGADILADLAETSSEIEEDPDTSGEVLAHLAEVAPEDEEEVDSSAEVLGDLADAAPEAAADVDASAEALKDLKAVSLPEVEEDAGADVLADLAETSSEIEEEPDTSGEVLAHLAEVAPEDEEEVDSSAEVLGDLADAAPEAAADVDASAEALKDLKAVSLPEVEEDTGADVLAGLAETSSEIEEEPDTGGEVLAHLAEVAPEDEKEVDSSAEVLGDLADTISPDAAIEDTKSQVLAELVKDEPSALAPEQGNSDILSDLAASVPQEISAVDASEDVLADLADAVPDEAANDSGVDDLLGELAADAPDEAADDSGVDDLLGELAADAPDEATADSGVDDLLGELATDTPDGATADSGVDDLLGELAADAPDEATDNSGVDDLLGELAADAPDEATADGGVDDLLGELAADAPDEAADDSGVDDLLGELAADAPDGALDDSGLDDLLDDLLPSASETNDEVDSDLSDLLGDLAESDDSEGGEDPDALLADVAVDPESPLESTDDLDSLLGDLSKEPEDSTPVMADADLDDLLGELSPSNDPIGETDDVAADAQDGKLTDLLPELEEDEPDDLDALLADLEDEDEEDQDNGLGDLDVLMTDLKNDGTDQAEDELDALFSDLENVGEKLEDPADTSEDDDDLDALLAGLDDEPESDVEDDLDALLADLGDDPVSSSENTTSETSEPAPANKVVLSGDPQFSFGALGAARPDAQRLNRKRFRIAVFGDFSGRSARGVLEAGDDLASRKPVILDPDTVDEVIERFATTLILPIGKDGVGIEVKLKELDDLHPDELYENVELFSGLAGLKSQLNAGATATNAAQQLKSWGESFGQKVTPPRKTSGGTTVRADLKLSEFQQLIGDAGGALTAASPLDDLLARVVGPHIRAIPDADTQAMEKAVDSALSDAMRLVLHHPEFASVEAQWRSLDLIARSVETDDTLDVILYDISAEEIAADLASADELSSSGLARLLTEEPLDQENGRGGYSALMGLYTFEETPPHAELLGRVARVAAHVDAPFITAITPAYLNVDMADRHPLVAQAWDTLRSMPEAGYLGLASPRFLLRRPYGQKSEPIYEFDFEEFTMSEGLRGMLWANPVVLVTILLAKSFRQNGASMGLGQIMSLGEMPYHYVNDQYGDQVALPCTERNISLAKHEHSVQRGYMPVLSVKGRDEIRLGSFNSVAGREILGPWSGVEPPKASPPNPPPVAEASAVEDIDVDDLMSEIDDDGSSDDDLDALLASFDDAGNDDEDSDIDAELAALLEDL